MHVLFKYSGNDSRRKVVEVPALIEADEDDSESVAGRRLLGKEAPGSAHARDKGRRDGSAHQGTFAEEPILQLAIASELNVQPSDLRMKSYMDNGLLHTETMFKGFDSMKLGYQLEVKVLANQFNPIPHMPIHRLYVEEIFDCGAHAAQATHSNLIGDDTFSVSDTGFRHVQQLHAITATAITPQSPPPSASF